MILTVFLVEDSPTIRDNLIPTLHDLAHAEVVEVVGGEIAAREWLACHCNWSLAVVDLFLKDGSGLGVLDAIKTRQPDQAAVILTNYATDDVRSRCLRLGADRVFDKSTELGDFIDYCLARGELAD